MGIFKRIKIDKQALKCGISQVIIGIILLSTFQIVYFRTRIEKAERNFFSISRISLAILSIFLLVLLIEYKIYIKNKSIEELYGLKNRLDKEVEERKSKERELKQSYVELSAVYEQLRVQYDELLENQEKLRINEERYKLVVEASNDGIYEIDIKNDSDFFSDGWKKIAGYDENTDINERKKWEEKVYLLAYSDLLTGLPNKAKFLEELGKRISENKEENNRTAVLSLDLDNFKNINDTMGHESGDQLILQISRKLRESLDDNIMISRFAGDDFLILIPQVYSKDQLSKIAKTIDSIFHGFWVLGNSHVYVTVSMGIAIYPENGRDVSSILRNANTAMHKSKANGKSKYLFFEESMYKEIARKTIVENALRKALRDDELELYYQPQVDIKTNRIIGLEALLRWKSKEIGLVSPAEFIPIAEETGLIIEIGKWTMRTACKQNKVWKSKGYEYNTIAVNVSALELQQVGFIECFKSIIIEEGINPEYVELEITESMLMKSVDNTMAILHDLKTMGIKIALDDFGTGYSSLNYLMHIPINTVKVDRSFVKGICDNLKNRSIAEAITILAHNIDLEVVAEGVETVDQLKLLEKMQCDKIQGYIFSKPYPANEIEEMLQRGVFVLNGSA